MFAEIPNKIPTNAVRGDLDVWPSYGDLCEMNKFYRDFCSAEGWIGESYIGIWKPQEVKEYEPIISKTYPSKYHFFATDGGGSKFGFFKSSSNISYICAPDIGSEEDIRVLGDWDAFIGCLHSGDYI